MAIYTTAAAFLLYGIQELPTAELKKDDPTCAICYRTFRGSDHELTRIGSEDTAAMETEQAIRIEACGHVFGVECIQEHVSADIESSCLCPICREPLFYVDDGAGQDDQEILSEVLRVRDMLRAPRRRRMNERLIRVQF